MAGEQIVLASLPNLRDIGGWRTSDGYTVRSGLLYRSAELSNLTDGDLATLDKLGIRIVFDLRTSAERDQAPDQLPAGARLEILDVLGDAQSAAPAHLAELFQQAGKGGNAIPPEQVTAAMVDAYRQFVTLPSALHAYTQLYTAIAEPADLPALFHCTAGKDRTGWASAALLLLLGVPYDSVRQDYLLTNQELLPSLQPMLAQAAAHGIDAGLVKLVMQADESYLQAAIDEVNRVYGSIEGWFAEGLGIDHAGQQALRDGFLSGLTPE